MNAFFESLARVDAAALARRYRSARPFPHLVLDDLLPEPLALELERQARAASAPLDTSNAFTQKDKVALNDWRLMPPALQQFCAGLQTGPFITFLEQLTGLPGLIADPHLEGGGLHRTATGGFLKMHTDFNWNARLRLYRRLNVLLYLNSGYRSDWDGQLLLTRHPNRLDGSEVADSGSIDSDLLACIEPRFNRLVVFETNDITFHGHPQPHRFPPERPRTSLAFYYYTVSAPPWWQRRRLRTASTRYVLRRGESADAPSLRRRIGYWLRRWTPLG